MIGSRGTAAGMTSAPASSASTHTGPGGGVQHDVNLSSTNGPAAIRGGEQASRGHAEIAGGVTAPRGFVAAGIHCGVKKAKKDLALIVSAGPAITAATFTTNLVVAAPVTLTKEHLAHSRLTRAIVVNSGNANACTGERGLDDARLMARTTGEALGIDPREVLVSSTGVIGQYLPIEKVCEGHPQGGRRGRARRRTGRGGSDPHDRHIHQRNRRPDVGGRRPGRHRRDGERVRHDRPEHGHDARVRDDRRSGRPRAPATGRFGQVVDRSFNRISVDGETSTNDMVALLANGEAGNPALTSPDDPGYAAFRDALEHVLVRLSKMIVVDGEGATKFVEIIVRGAADERGRRAGRPRCRQFHRSSRRP